MPFINKQPYRQPRALNLVDCPPHNEPHAPCLYPLYYNALYYPQYHESCFSNPTSVSAWLMHELDSHPDWCVSCTPKPFCAKYEVAYSKGIFTVIGIGTLSLTLADIESANFNFCRLFDRLLQNHPSGDKLAETAMSVLSNIPIWLFHDDAHLTQALSELSCTELYHTVCKLVPSKHLPLARKSEYVRLILHDFIVQRTRLLDSDLTHIVSNVCHECLLISKFFQDRYGKSVAASFRCSLTKPQFEGIQAIFEPTSCDDVPWFGASFYDMDVALLRLLKKIILRCLQNIPSYIRPAYKSRSVQSCSSALVHHIRSRIHHLRSLKDYQFFQVYFLVLSFCTDYRKPRAKLIERILTYEYKHEIIGTLSSSHLSRNSRRKIERQEAKIQNVAETLAWERQLRSSWPTIVDDDTIFHCLERYRRRSVWEPPLMYMWCLWSGSL
jgi:hypothetical protein